MQFLRTAFVGIAIGLVLAVVALFLRKRLGNAVLETSLILLLPFTGDRRRPRSRPLPA